MAEDEWGRTMTEDQWLACTDSAEMQWFLKNSGRLGKKGSERKLRLFGCACVRRIWYLLKKRKKAAANRVSIEKAERFADGLATEEELHRAYFAAGPTARCPSGPNAFFAAMYSMSMAAKEAGVRRADWSTDYPAELATQSHLFRDIFGNPFRRVKLNQSWVKRNDGKVLKMARSIYEERAFDQLPILADALEEAGCNNRDILAHCRQSGEHVPGCWVIDLLLGKS
jgi:hypothetical protein